MFYFVFDHKEKPNLDGLAAVGNSELRYRSIHQWNNFILTNTALKHNDRNYIYPIEIFGYILDRLSDVTFSDEVIQLYKKGNLKFLINYSHEFRLPDDELYTYSWNDLHKNFSKQGINPSDVIIFLGQTNALTNFPNLKNFDFKFKFNDAVLYSSAEKAKDIDGTIINNNLGYDSEFVTIKEIDTFKRSKRFMCLNRGVSYHHRITLGAFLELNNYWDDFHASFLFTNNKKEDINSYLIKTPDDKLNQMLSVSVLSFYDKIGKIEVDTHGVEDKESWDGKFEGGKFYKKEAYLDSYINVVTETNFLDNQLFVTDKVFHPILNYQPFLVFGCYGWLRYLKKYGFKTFHPFIDESYDEIENDGERIKFLFDEIKRLKSKSIDEIHEWYCSIKDILIYNRNHLLSFASEDCWTEYIEEEFIG